MSSIKNNSGTSHLMIAILFVLSGFSSLVLQVLWTRLLSLGVGSTSSALSISLSIFFLGLAGGSFIISRWIHKIQSPLRAYAWIEAIVGLLSLPICLALFEFPTLMQFFGVENSFSFIGVTTKFILVFILLIIPTLGMGATLPLLVKHLESVEGPEKIQKNIAFLYGINTLGACLGCIGASFILIPFIGILSSAGLVMTLNVIVALVLLVKVPKVEVNLQEIQSIQIKKQYTSKEVILLLSVALTGLSSLAAEIVWNKYLGIFLGTNIYGLGLNLGVFLLGIALGSLVFSKYVNRIKSLEKTYTYLLAFTAIALFLTSYLLNHAPRFSVFLSVMSQDFIPLFVSKTIVIFFFMIAPTSLLGALFPCAIALLEKWNSGGQAAQSTGLAYAVNTLGAIIGSVLAGHVLIPLWGSSGTMLFAYLALLSVSLIFVFLNFSKILKISFVVLFAAIGFQLNAIDYKNIVKAAYIQSTPTVDQLSQVFKIFEPDYEDFKLIIEGETAVITLSHDPMDGVDYKKYIRLKSNGLNESIYDPSNLEALPKYEALLGFLPHLFARNPQNAFVVGYGGGCTADYLTRSSLKEVHVVELEEGVIDAAQYIYNGQNPILERKTLKLEVEDARFVLTNSDDASFDMIMSQPSHSWLSGVANLFTKDFFEIVHSKLSDEGVFSQWLNLYNINSNVLKSILRTFYTVFPHGAVFTDYGDTQIILLGSKKSMNLSLQKLKLMSQNPIFRNQLVYVPFSNSEDILSIFSLGRTDIMRLTEGSKLNTDNNAYAETLQSRIFYSKRLEESDAQDFLSEQYSANFEDILEADEYKSSEFRMALVNSLYHYQKLDKLNSFFINDPNPSESKKMFREFLTNLKLGGQYEGILSLNAKYPNLFDTETICYVAFSEVQLGQSSDIEASKVLLKSPQCLSL